MSRQGLSPVEFSGSFDAASEDVLMRHQKVLRCGIKRCALRPSALRVRARAVRHRRGIASGERGQALGDSAAHRGRGGRSRGRLRRRGQARASRHRLPRGARRRGDRCGHDSHGRLHARADQGGDARRRRADASALLRSRTRPGGKVKKVKESFKL